VINDEIDKIWDTITITVQCRINYAELPINHT